MRTGGVPAAALLLLALLAIQVSTAEDIYWEGEEDAFLEVKPEDTGFASHLRRLKRDLFDPFSLFSKPSEDKYDSVTEDDEISDGKEDDLETDGSGQPDNRIETELREKTLRVTFVVMEPYRDKYSNRDSVEFQNLSQSLADSVNLLFESLPGTQKASLVRIQSRLDGFSCKVTLDIVTTGYDNTDRITQILRDHIRNRALLGNSTVKDDDFSATVIDPETYSEQTNVDRPVVNEDEGDNEVDEDTNTVTCSDPIPCYSSSVSYCDSQRCDGIPVCPAGDDEKDCESFDREDLNVPESSTTFAPQRGDQSLDIDLDTTTNEYDSTTSRTTEPPPVNEFDNTLICLADEIRCDFTRCIKLSQRCDSRLDCDDGTDEAGCPESCGVDDFRCDNGKCIEGIKRCDRVSDCPRNEDENNCACRSDEFRCVSDGSCIESRKRCDGIDNCNDKSDEVGCGGLPCPPEYNFTCGPLSSTPCAKQCDGTVECDGGEDENACKDTCNHYCDGRCLEDDNICDGISNCADGSDELNCDRCDGPEDFRCNTGECLHIDAKCNNLRDCPRGEDELNCNATIIPTSSGCLSNQFTCKDGSCIDSQFLCDKNKDCYDNSDEEDCPSCPNSDDFKCQDGTCISSFNFCNGNPDCPDGSDEENCPCDAESWQCRSGQCIPEIARCDGRLDCSDDTDEEGCSTESNFIDGGSTPTNPIFVTTQRPSISDYGSTTSADRPNSGGRYPYPEQPGGVGGYNPYEAERGSSYRPETGDWGRPRSESNGGNRYPDAPPVGSGNDPFGYGVGTGDNGPYGSGGSESAQPGVSRLDGSGGSGGRPYGSGAYGSGNDRLPPGVGDNTVGGTGPYESGISGGGNIPYDSSTRNEGPAALNIKTYPQNQAVRYANTGGDVVFQCRDEGPLRAPVRWVKEGGRPLKAGSRDVNGRLEMFGVTPSDSGTYICQAPSFLREPGSEVRVTLEVESAPITQRPAFITCQQHEATCGNGQCIPKSAVCDGKIDCADRSDEDTCHTNGMCEPNQFQCNNGKCVLKTWICDSDNDCDDNSDEMNCAAAPPGQPCKSVEFSCSSGTQCLPKSYHCDGQSDCMDGSDEIGCAPVHVTSPPKPSNLRLNPGDTLILVCEAVGIPVPLISWRLNWGHVPSKCTSVSQNGVGTLTCNNMEPQDSGAYSCEAMNNKGTTFATPDSIVHVNKTDPCPPGYFNNEARSQNECIRCFCFGESTQCRSADLFTYNMPTALGEGGTRLLGVTQTPSGEIRTDSPIGNQYLYQPLRNGATVTKVVSDDASWPWSSTHPYLTLPESYNGNQLTSYGGHIKYTISPHAPVYAPDTSTPTIIIKGKYGNLFHFHRGDTSRNTNIEARLTPENWEKPSPRGLVPATREDIMMALDNIEMILLRADLNNAGVNVSDFAMESAQHINVGLGVANLVEECTCPPGYEGLSCERCAVGYVRESTGRWLGNCVRETCPPGTYGDPASGYACKPCPCPLTNRDNQFARTCSIGPDGNVLCDCNPGYEGKRCEVCAPGYVGNPIVPGDSCKPRPTDNCNPTGTRYVRPPDECDCKDNVQGRYCDQCKNDSFYLSEDFRHGCAICFCSGVSQQCRSSDYRRKTTAVQFNVPDIVNQIDVYNSAPAGPAGSVRYTAPLVIENKPELIRGQITLSSFQRSQTSVYYWSLPSSFSGDKVTSYGGYLRYTLQNVPTYDTRLRNNAADVQLISLNHLTFHYTGSFQHSFDGTLNASVQFLEKGWQRSDGKEVSREHFLLALADVKTILIKATYSDNAPLAIPLIASIETAEATGDGPKAYHVEQCVCPSGYVGTSCEDCAPGFTRSSSGLYLEHCGPCLCNGHSNMCHPETGICYDCADNTDGPHCEICKSGYDRDSYGNCVSSSVNNITCRCDPAGSATACDNSGYCNCKEYVEGENCDRCRPGTFGLDSTNPLGCQRCYCSGVTSDCHEGTHYTRIPIAAPILGDTFGGFTIMDLNAEQVINDDFVPVPDKSELMYSFSFVPNQELYWSLPVYPGNRVLSYGGSLSLRQEFRSNDYGAVSEPGTDVVLVGDDVSLYWTNPNRINAGESLSYQVPLRENDWYILNTVTPVTRERFLRVLANLKRVLVRATIAPNILSTSIADVSMDTATNNNFAESFAAKGIEVCMCPPGYDGTSCESCASGYYKDQTGRCQKCSCNGHECQLDVYGQVVCNCRPPYTGSDCLTVAGEPSVVVPDTPPPPPKSTVVVEITSPTIKIREVGSSVNFTCQAKSALTSGRLRISWSKVDGYLPQGRSQTDENTGVLFINNLQVSDSGQYLCQTSDGLTTGQAIATLKVPGNEMTMPTASIRPTINDYYEGDRIELECDVSGNPAPTIRWQRASNRPLPVSAEHFDKLFIIESAREEDSGEYRCIASNAVGSADRTAIITVRPRPSWPSRDKLTVSSSSPTVDEGQSTRVVCTGTINIPAGSIDWIRQDGAPLSANIRSDNGVLYVDFARLEDRGVYVCQTSAPNIALVPVLLTVVPQGTPPPSEASNITVSVDRLKVPTGESGTVDCNPQGYPQPLIKWSKHQSNFGPSTSQRGNTLIIGRAQEDDEGYYLCEGIVNGNPIAYIYVFVEIEKREQPRVEIWPQGEQIVSLGSPYELHCRVTGGHPEPDVTWSRSGGKPLASYAHIQPYNVLKFDRIDVNDEGEYTCTGTNIAGSISASAVLKVRSPPEITITPSNFQQVLQGEPVTVECRASGYPDPTVSIKTSVDLREVVRPSPRIAVLRIPSASERDSTDYICLATSVAGTTEEQFGIRVERGDGGAGDFVEGSGYDENGDRYTPDQGRYDPDRYPSTSDRYPSDPNRYPTTNRYPTDTDRYPPDTNSYPTDPNSRPGNLIAIEGQPEITISCSGSEGYEPRWSRVDRQPLQRNAIQRDSRLIIYNVSKSDSSQYICNLYNINTREIVKAAYTNLLVISVPRITLRPPIQSVHPGQSPTVECVVEGDNIIDITWKPYNRAPSRRAESRGATLIFHQIEVEDEGKYECFARSQFANASAIAEVIVSEENDRVASESHDNEQFAHSGAAVHLSCNVTQPDLIIEWTKDGRPVSRSHQKHDGSLFIRLAQKSDSGRYVCHIRDKYGRHTSNYINLHIQGSGGEDRPAAELVSIVEPRSSYRVSDNVEVVCKSSARNINVRWERYGTNQYVETKVYGDGVVLIIHGVQESDAGLYRCTGMDPYGATFYRDFRLVVVPGYTGPTYSDNTAPLARYEARLSDVVDLPCQHTLEEPVTIEWTKEYSSLPTNVATNQPTLHIEPVTEADAGTYICRVSNYRHTVESKAILRVTGVVPRFDGGSWLSLPPMKDAYKQFDIEISFRPTDSNGLILYNSQNQGRTGDYVALQLIDGIPQFLLETATGIIEVKGDRPLQLNEWHTIRISRTGSRLTMDVDNTGPFITESPNQWTLLELKQPLYIGGVPDFDQLPSEIAGVSGFAGCISMLILGNEEKNIMALAIDKQNVQNCFTCAPNLCLNDGVCQEALTEHGYVCLCAPGFGGTNCDRIGESCRPGLCGPGKCITTADGYKCACPVTYTGKNCEVKQSIEYPAFTGSAYLAIKPPNATRSLKMSMKIKASSPVTDGIIMYCAENPRGYGGFTSLAVRNGKLEFRYDLGGGSKPVVLTNNKTLPANEWTDVHIARYGRSVTLKINLVHSYEQWLEGGTEVLKLETPMFVGGFDDSIILNNNTGVTGGFNGCIKDVMIYENAVDIVNSSIQSANVQECSNYDRGDIPEIEGTCQCRNGGSCQVDSITCICPLGFTGTYCENRVPNPVITSRMSASDPCSLRPCRNGGTCRPDLSSRMNHTCDCPLGFAGASCQMPLQLLQSVGFSGNGYLELPAELLRYDDLQSEPAVIALAIHTTNDGVLLYQREALSPLDRGDYILLRIERGIVVLDWDLGSGTSTVAIENVRVNDGERHQIIAKLHEDNTMSLSVDSTTRTGVTTGLSNLMSADSNIYIGGIPDRINVRGYPGLVGCIEQVELMSTSRGLNLGQVAVAGRNTQRCREYTRY